ncbi:beta-ketoacyl reductase, partial [Micromonospora sp. NPDC049645]|uniref:acyl carrier protein n=1 Tax=Micromonospora sp. NPDC049645 TaxID=3155508 RepID=UPI003430E262
SEQGLALFDTAIRTNQPQLVPIRVDLPALRRTGAGAVPPLWQTLAGGTARRAATTTDTRVDLATRLAAMGVEERQRTVLELVRAQAAVVLGHADPTTIDPHSAFRELGFDSLTAVELRNRLATATGLSLPATLVFDYPTPAELGRELWTRVVPEEKTPANALQSDLDRIEQAIRTLAPGDGRDPTQLADRLRELVRRLEAQTGGHEAIPVIDTYAASDDELFDVLDKIVSSEGGRTA